MVKVDELAQASWTDVIALNRHFRVYVNSS